MRGSPESTAPPAPDTDQVRDALRRAAAVDQQTRSRLDAAEELHQAGNPGARSRLDAELHGDPARFRVRELARRLVMNPSPAGRERMSAAAVEVHEIAAALHALAARVERLARSALSFDRPGRHLPDGLVDWLPGDSFDLPAEYGGGFVESDPEAFFWGELDLSGLREELSAAAEKLARDLNGAGLLGTIEHAQDQLERLPLALLDAVEARLAEVYRQPAPPAPRMARKPKGKRGAK
ncbi:MAG: hypothetical protein ACREF4_17595 [Gammaproteobacteria bacterium]